MANMENPDYPYMNPARQHYDDLRRVVDEQFAKAKKEFREEMESASATANAPAIRLECLKVAQGDVATARDMYAFVVGKEAK